MLALDLIFKDDAVTYLEYAEVLVLELLVLDPGFFVDKYCLETYLVFPLYFTFVQLPLVP